MSLRARERDTLGCGRNAVGKKNIPALLAVINLQDNTCDSWRVVHWRVEDEKIGAKFPDAQRKTVDQQSHPNVGGVPAMTCF